MPAGQTDHRPRGGGRPRRSPPSPTAVPNAARRRRGEHRRQGVPHQGRPHGVRAGLLPVQPVADRDAADRRRSATPSSTATPGRRDGRRHRRGRAGRRRRQQRRPGRARRDPARRASARWSCSRSSSRSFLAFLPLLVAAVVDPGDVPAAAADHLRSPTCRSSSSSSSRWSASAWRSTTRCCSSPDGARSATTAATTTRRSSSRWRRPGTRCVFSGVTVAIGLLALIVLPVPFMRSMGYGGALIPLASVLTTLTPDAGDPRRHRADASTGRRSGTRTGRAGRGAGGPALVVRHRWIAAGRGTGRARRADRRRSSASRSGWRRPARSRSSGPAYDALQTLEAGRRVHRHADPDRGARRDRPGPDRRRPTSAKVDGVDARLRRRPAPASNRNGQTVVVLIPDDGDGQLQERRRGHAASRTPPTGLPGVIGVTGLGAAQIDFLHAVYGNFPLMLAHHRGAHLHAAGARVPVAAAAAQGGAAQPRRRWRRRSALMVLFWQDGHGSNADLRHRRRPARSRSGSR